jgi:AcrR family transcriptional regulator
MATSCCHFDRAYQNPQVAIDRPKRRTEGVHKAGRAATVVDRVLRATAHELGRVGYEALRFEEVAKRSKVHKTTIYRRWPTRAKLVEDALCRFMVFASLPDFGELEADLVSILGDYARFALSPLGRGISRMLQTERFHPDLASILKRLRQRKRNIQIRVLLRAVERGELPLKTNCALVLEVLTGALMSRLVGRGEAVDAKWIQDIVALVISGAKANPNVPPTPGKSSKIRNISTRNRRS